MVSVLSAMLIVFMFMLDVISRLTCQFLFSNILSPTPPLVRPARNQGIRMLTLLCSLMCSLSLALSSLFLLFILYITPPALLAPVDIHLDQHLSWTAITLRYHSLL